MKKIVKWIAILACLTLVLFFVFRPSHPSEIIFTGGDIITMAEEGALDSYPQAVYVRDGTIQFVGDREQALAMASGDVEIVDLEGNTLLPGLIEPHTHPIATAMLGQAIDVSGFTYGSRSEIMTALQEQAKGKPFMKWTVAFGWDPVMVEDLEPPTLAELDGLSPDKPFVILTQMMHDAYANSKALEASGITKDTPNPPGGEFVKDSNGNLTGTIREISAINYLTRAMPVPPKGSVDLLLSLQYGKYAKAGFTTIGALGPVGRTDDPDLLLERLSKDPATSLRVITYCLPEQIKTNHWKPGQGDDKFRMQGVKFWMDGSPFAGGAAFAEPYENSELVTERLHLKKDHMGPLNYEADDFAEKFTRYHNQGYQIAVHAQGERAIDRVLDACEKALNENPRKDHRHRMEHCALITKAQLERAQALGVTLSFFADHIYFYGDKLPQIVGPDRTQRYMPLGAARDAGHTITVHTDNPATPVSPFRALRTAVLRKTRSTGEVLGEDQKISMELALRAITTNAAWQLGMEDKIGSIETGKLADFTVLKENPFKVDPARLPEIQVQSTWVSGRKTNLSPWTWQNIKMGLAMVGNLF